MPLVIVRGQSSTWIGLLAVTRTWALAGSGQIGQATFSIPRTDRAGNPHPLANPAFFDPLGGAVITIMDDNGSGVWRGIHSGGIVWTPAGAQITAYQLSRVLSRRRVNRQNFTHVQAGAIMGRALDLTVPGVPGLSIATGSFDGNGPMLDYTFDGQDLMSVVNDLAPQSGEVLSIDDSGVVAWGPPLETGQPGLLIAGSDVTGWTYGSDPTGLSASVESVGASGLAADRVTVVNGVAAAHNWPTQDTADTSDTNPWSVLRTATGALDAAQGVGRTFSGTLAPSHRTAREGDIYRVLVPTADWTGRVVTVMLASRTVDPASPGMAATFALYERGVDTPIVQRSGPQNRVRGRHFGASAPARIVDLERSVAALSRGGR